MTVNLVCVNTINQVGFTILKLNYKILTKMYESTLF